jgi:plastocyanin
MAKQQANNGIDYTPRREKAIKAAAEARNPQQRHIHGVVQRQQRYPIFEVTAAGKTVEWTDTRAAAHSAFHDADALPKRLMLVHEDGRRELLDEVTQTRRRLSEQEPMKLAA